MEAQYARNKEMLRLRNEKRMSLQEIANIYGITRERVRQIIGNTGRDIQKSKTAIRDAHIRQAIHKTNDEIAEVTGLSIPIIRKARKGTHHAVMPDSPIGRGQEAEHFVSGKLSELGIDNKLMPLKHPFDILVNGSIRVDVKSAYTTVKTNPRIKSPQYHFVDRKGGVGCDYFVCVIWLTKDSYIIPAHLMKRHLYICHPSGRPEIAKYSKYLNAWDLLR